MQGHHIRVDLKLGVVRTRHFSWVVEIMYISRLRLGLYHLVSFYSFVLYLVSLLYGTLYV